MTNRKLLCSLVAFGIITPAALLVSQDAKKEVAATPAQAMLETAREAYNLQLEMRKRGEMGHVAHDWSERLVEAELLVAKTADQRRTAINEHIERTVEMLEIQKQLRTVLEASTLDVLEWEYRLAAAKQKLAAGK